MSDKETALRRMVGQARDYVLVMSDMTAHKWEMEWAERNLDRAARDAVSAGASQAEVTRITAVVARLMNVDGNRESANPAA